METLVNYPPEMLYDEYDLIEFPYVWFENLKTGEIRLYLDASRAKFICRSCLMFVPDVLKYCIGRVIAFPVAKAPSHKLESATELKMRELESNSVQVEPWRPW